MLCSLDHLQSDEVPNIERHIRHQWDLRQTEGSIVHDIARSCNLEGCNDIVAHVRRCKIIRSLDADIDVKECARMAWKPSWLNSDCDQVSIMTMRA